MLNGQDVVCIYQDVNLDSFAAAWCVWKRYPNAQFITQVDSSLPRQIEGRRVYILGATFSVTSLIDLATHAGSITVVDCKDSFEREFRTNRHQLPNNLFVVFDKERSIAGLAWDFFSFNQTRSPVVNYIEDRTLWRFQYPETRPVTTALMAYPLSFEAWDALILQTDVGALVQEGEVLLRRLIRDVEQVIRTTRRRITLAGYDVPAVNVSPALASEAGVQLAKGEPFAVGYWDTPNGRVFDLVSVGDGVDVSELVAVYGGYGSRHEAAFVVPRDHPLCAA